MSERITEVLHTRITRRKFLGTIGLAGGALLTSNIPDTRPSISPITEFKEPSNPPMSLGSESMMQKIIDEGKALQQNEENSEKGLTVLVDTVLNTAGTALFAEGIYQLTPNGRGHIGASEYAWLYGLLQAKHFIGDDETKHHIEEEMKASLLALGIILGSSTAAEGLNIDIEKSYTERNGSAPKLEDKVALVTMAASMLSPLGTTVSAASALADESQNIARDVWKLQHPGEEAGEKDLNHPTVAALIDHVSNSSGFILFGDPPFIAMVETYGFGNAINYQFQTMLPSYMVSLLAANMNINSHILEAEGITGAEAKKESFKRSIAALARNSGFIAEIAAKSAQNTLKYISGAEKLFNIEQDRQGFELSIAGVFKDKFTNILKLATNPEQFKLPLHNPDVFEGLTQVHIPELEADQRFTGATLEDWLVKHNLMDSKLVHETISTLLHNENYNELEQWLIEKGASNAVGQVELLKNMVNQRVDTLISSERSRLSKLLEMVPGFVGRYYHKINSISLHNAVGSKVSDVIGVFPFQAGCIPLIAPIYEKGVNLIQESIKGNQQFASLPLDVLNDAVLYVLTQAFSSVADNYVAMKMGLKVAIDKPALILAASIRGGVKLSPLSNMADVIAFPMKKYGLQDSARQLSKGAGLYQDLFAFIWSEVIDKVMTPMGILNTPEPLVSSAHH